MIERLLQAERRINQLEAALAELGIGNHHGTNTRIARAVALSGQGYPSTGNVFGIQFLDGEYTKATGTISAVYANRSAPEAVAFNLRGNVPPEGSVVLVFEWKGYWWTSYDTSTPGGGSLLADIHTVRFANTTPDTTSPPTAFTNPAPVIDWANAETLGAVAGVTFTEANDSITYSEGSYLLQIMAHIDNQSGDHTTPGGAYVTPHFSEGHWILSGAAVELQWDDAGTWKILAAGYAFPGPLSMGQTATIVTRLKTTDLKSGDVDTRLALRNRSEDSADATMRCFHAEWTSQKITT